MALFDRLFRRRRRDDGPGAWQSDTSAATAYPTSSAGAVQDSGRDGNGDDGRGEVDPSVQNIQVGEEGSSQQIEVGDSGGGDSGGGGGDGGGGGNGGGGGE